MSKKARLIRRTPIGDIVRSEWDDLRLRLPRDSDRAERCHQNRMMHEMIFVNERYFGEPHNILFGRLRTLRTIPKEVIEYRIKCLKGKAPANVPAIVYEYPPPHRGAPHIAGPCIAFPWWTYPWILPGDTPETTKGWDKADPKDYVRTKPDEIKSSIKSLAGSIENYNNDGGKYYPEYAFIADRKRERIESLNAILQEKIQKERAKYRRGKAA